MRFEPGPCPGRPRAPEALPAQDGQAGLPQFESFWRRYEQQIRSAIVGGFGAMEDQEEAVADAFAWAWRTWPRIVTEVTNPPGYLYRVARNALIRRAARAARQLPVDPLPEDLDRLATTLPLAGSANLPIWRAADVEPGFASLFNSLPLEHRIILWMRWEGYHYDEIVEILREDNPAMNVPLARKNYQRAERSIFGVWSDSDHE